MYPANSIHVVLTHSGNTFNKGLFKSQEVLRDDPYQALQELQKYKELSRTEPVVVVFTGGSDVTPQMYAPIPPKLTVRPYTHALATSLYRDIFESFVYRVARGLGFPIFGFCRGHQFISVMEGGSLIKDIGCELGVTHAKYTHGIRFEGGDPSFKEMFTTSPFGENIVSSTHHQAVHRYFKPHRAKVIASADDVKDSGGTFILVEALHYTQEKMLTMQCHPEHMNWVAPIEILVAKHYKSE